MRNYLGSKTVGSSSDDADVVGSTEYIASVISGCTNLVNSLRQL